MELEFNQLQRLPESLGDLQRLERLGTFSLPFEVLWPCQAKHSHAAGCQGKRSWTTTSYGSCRIASVT